MIDPSPIIDALALPPSTRVDRRVPKTLLVENGAPTTADKRLIQEGIEEMRWIASLKPNAVGIAAWRGTEGEYTEIAVLTATFREKAKPARLTGLIHRAIPYPLVLVTLSDQGAALSLAHKRSSQAEPGKTVLEDTIHSTPAFDPVSPDSYLSAFLGSLAIHRQIAGDMRVLYQAWIDRVTALHAAEVIGIYRTDRDAAQSAIVREALSRRESIEREIAGLRARAAKETQINRRVELNLQLKQLEARLSETTGNI
jgi:hypothetical protein